MTAKAAILVTACVLLAAPLYAQQQKPAPVPPAPASPPSAAPKPPVIEPLYLEKAVEEISKDTAALSALYAALTNEYLRQGRPVKALSLLATYEKAGGADLPTLSSLALLYEQAGVTDKAVQVRERVASLDPEHLWNDNRFQLTELYRRQKEYKKAADMANSVLRRQPGNRDFLRKLGEVQAESGDWNAEETFKKVLKSAPEYSDYIRLAEVYAAQKKYEDAETLLESAAAKFPAGAVDLGLASSAISARRGDVAKAVLTLNNLVWKTNDPDVKKRIQARALELQAPAPAPAGN